MISTAVFHNEIKVHQYFSDENIGASFYNQYSTKDNKIIFILEFYQMYILHVMA